MTKVSLLSDTHGYWDESTLQYFEGCMTEIWHAEHRFAGSGTEAGGFPSLPCRVILTTGIRRLYPQILRFTVDGAECCGFYRQLSRQLRPFHQRVAFWCVPKAIHQRALAYAKVKYDKTLDVLHINPGAAGVRSFHKVLRTMVRFAD